MEVSTRIVVLAAITGLLGGCATSPFYNEARDKQGQALVKAADKFELASLVDDLDKRFAALRVVELQTLRARQATQRDLEIASAVSLGGDGKGTLATRYVTPFIDQRIEQLVGRTMDAQSLDTTLDSGSISNLYASLRPVDKQQTQDSFKRIRDTNDSIKNVANFSELPPDDQFKLIVVTLWAALQAAVLLEQQQTQQSSCS